MVEIRPERPDDIAAIRTVNRLAFGQAGETALVDAGAALAPMAVSPERQREGVGSALVRAGLAGG